VHGIIKEMLAEEGRAKPMKYLLMDEEKWETVLE